MAARWEWVRRGIGRPSLTVAPDPVTGWTPKWGTARSIPLSDRAQAYLEEARVEWGGAGYVFSSERLRWPNFASLTRAAVQASNVTPVTFHGLRRSAGAHWLDCGVTLLEVSRLLGHQSITTTERWYAGVGDATLARAIELVKSTEQARAGLPKLFDPAFDPAPPALVPVDQAKRPEPRRRRVP
jgi:integrase